MIGVALRDGYKW